MVHIVVLYILYIQTVSVECMMPTKSRIVVLLMDGIQLVRLLLASNIFLENCGYSFHSTV